MIRSISYSRYLQDGQAGRDRQAGHPENSDAAQHDQQRPRDLWPDPSQLFEDADQPYPEDTHPEQRRRVGQPLQLLALLATGTPEPDDQGSSRSRDRQDGQEPGQAADRVHDLAGGLVEPDRRRGAQVGLGWVGEVAHRDPSDPADHQPGHRPPARRQQPTVGEQQQQRREGAVDGRDGQPGWDPGQPRAPRQAPGLVSSA